MTVKIKKASDKKVVINISKIVNSASWSGSDTQASRKFDFSITKNHFDGNFDFIEIELGDLVYFSFDGKQRFAGRVISKTLTSGQGEVSFSAADFMNLLLKSKLSANFKKTTPEAITKTVLSKMGVPCGHIEKTGVAIDKWIVEDETAYNIIIGAYYKAYKKTKKKYMPYMNGFDFCIGEKGKDSGARLYLDKNVKGTEFQQSAEEICNRVEIFDDKGKKIGRVEDKNSIKLFGVYQNIYKKEEGVNAVSEAKKSLVSPQKEASVDCIGDIECISGKSLKLYDRHTGLYGKFFIENDTHTFQNGQHSMSLKLAFKNIVEGEESKTGKNGKGNKKRRPVAEGNAAAYYSKSSKNFHSSKKCGTGLVAPIKTTVNEAVKLGKKKCSRCWQ